MSIRKVVFDIETKNLFEEIGSNNPADLDISVVSIYDSATETYQSFTEETLPKLWPILEQADMLIGYNSDHFDIPLLDKYYPGDLTKIKSLDIMREIRAVLGRRIKLDYIAAGTLGRTKISHGLEAVRWWKEGKIAEIIKYCEEDVHITKDIYEYALKNNKLLYKENGGPVQEIKLDTKGWEKIEHSTMTCTLPF
jgi:DEAD/DEAH box helicase domain-containing protein